MSRIRIVAGEPYPGEGISKGLACGLHVYCQECNLTGEGMGLGSVALRDHRYTYFSRSWTDSIDENTLTRTFLIDTRMIWSICEKPSPVLTRLIEYAVRFYMRIPGVQRVLMKPVFPLRTLLRIHPVFELIAPRGTVSFSYRINTNNIEIQVSVEDPLEQQEKLFLLNELSAKWFVAGWHQGRTIAPPPGWEKISEADLPVSLLDPVHGIRFFLDGLSVPTPVPFSIFRGREYHEDLAWAGFCIQLGPAGTLQTIPRITYRIGFSEGEYA